MRPRQQTQTSLHLDVATMDRKGTQVIVFGQLSLIHRARFCSLTSPAARARIIAAASASGAMKPASFTPGKV
jgi:hypothetical protein